MASHPGTKIYDLDYFSGSQMFLYIGDVWIDEVTSLQYSCQQQKSPIYGYASQLYDDVAVGQVFVQGAFTINYKEAAYLWTVLHRYKNMIPQIVSFDSKAGKKLDKAFTSQTPHEKTQTASMGWRPMYTSMSTNDIQRKTIEELIQGNVTKGNAYSFYQDLAGFATGATGKDEIFANLCDAFEDELWTKSNVDVAKQIRRLDDNKFDGFDIYVVFGNYAVPGANHTVQKITDVRLTSQSKAIRVSGEPIQEEYQFIARAVE